MIFRIQLQTELEARLGLFPVARAVCLHGIAKTSNDINHVREGLVVVIIEHLVNANRLCLAFDDDEVDGSDAAVATTYVAMTRARAALWMSATPEVAKRLWELARARLLAGEEATDD